MIYLIRQWSEGNIGCLVAHLAERRIRCQVVDAWLDGALPPLAQVNGIIALGGPANVRDFADDPQSSGLLKREARYLWRARALGIPVLGVGQAHQLLGAMRGNHVRPTTAVRGLQAVETTEQGREFWLFAGLPPRFEVYENRSEELRSLSPGSVVLATSATSGTESVAWDEWTVSLQFHPEVFKRTIDPAAPTSAVQHLHGPNLGYDEVLRRMMDNFAYRVGCLKRPAWFDRPWHELQGTDSAA